MLELDGDGSKLSELAGHFLGAVVLKQLQSAAGDPLRSSVIDGQQRLTTLQLLLDAAQLVTEGSGDPNDAESLQELVLNESARFRGTPKRFKLWPSRIDRQAFEWVMDNNLTGSSSAIDSRVAQAHQFFQDSIAEWADVNGDPDKASRRLRALAQVLQDQLQIVAITLAPNDDDQLIFETLNDRGTPLLAADLIKNYVFQRCEEIGADVDSWSEKYWLDFDTDWWRDEVAQGRLYRSRIDLFLQYWLTMRIRDEIGTGEVFSRFRNYADEHLQDVGAAEAFLAGLRRDADTFRDFAQLDPTTVRGSFHSRVIEALELGVFIPLLLWLISENHDTPPDQIDRALTATESWAVRRTLLRQTMKDVNKLVVALLRALDRYPLGQVGEATAAFLLDQTADARVWPSDDELRQALPETRLYGNIKQQRLRAVLSAVEMKSRSDRHEDVSLPTRLDIEHIMPQGWRTHWGEGVVQDLERSIRRDFLVNTLGNLTLVTQKLNVALSNRPWTDAEAERVAPTGKDAGKGKWSLLDRFSVLMLNKDVVGEHVDAWTEQDIIARTKTLTDVLIGVWPRG
jgi:hypothetical protein